MATYELVLRIRGPARELDIPATPPTFEADSFKEALQILANSEFPDNDMVKTVGLTLKRVTDLEVSPSLGFTSVGEGP